MNKVIIFIISVVLLFAQSATGVTMQGAIGQDQLNTELNARDKHLTVGSKTVPAVDLQILDGFFPETNIIITKMSIFAQTVPTGADLLVDLTIGGVAQSRIATLTAGTANEETNITDLTVTSGSRVGAKFTQIGSTVGGDGVTVTFHYKTTD